MANEEIGIATDGQNVFFGVNLGGGENDPDSHIYSVPLMGGEQTEVAAAVEITALAADASGLYYLALDEGVGPFHLHHVDPPSGDDRIVASIVTRATALALDADNAYVAGFSGVGSATELFRISKTLSDALPSEYVLVASAIGNGYPRDLVVSQTTALWSADAQRSGEVDGRLWSAQLSGTEGIAFVGEGLGYVQPQGLAANGTSGFALVSNNEGVSEFWRFELGTLEPSVLRATAFGALLPTNDHLYWVNNQTTDRSGLDGVEVQHLYDCGGGHAAQTDDLLVVGGIDESGLFGVWVLDK